MRQRNLLLTLVLLVAAETASYDDSEKTLSQNHDSQFMPNDINEEVPILNNIARQVLSKALAVWIEPNVTSAWFRDEYFPLKVDPHSYFIYSFSALLTKYIRHISSIMNAYRSDVMGGRLIVETNSQVDTRYRTWKRNADLINSLLALPKGMNEAGR